MICKDPDFGEACLQSNDGDTLSYHVEFLGKKHCHGWIRAPMVTKYMTDNESDEVSPRLPADVQGRKTKV